MCDGHLHSPIIFSSLPSEEAIERCRQHMAQVEVDLFRRQIIVDMVNNAVVTLLWPLADDLADHPGPLMFSFFVSAKSRVQ